MVSSTLVSIYVYPMAEITPLTVFFKLQYFVLFGGSKPHEMETA